MYVSYMADPVVLTPELAQEIAGDTTDIIGFNVLITDREGIVIGSGERARVGTFHEASIDVVRTQRSATHTAAEARRMRGVRPGITLPIVIGDTAVGTVGITGSPVQVRRFGLVVKRQTEILLQESRLLRSRLVREHCDQIVSIPIDSDMESLNASMAVGISLYEVSRQRAGQ